MSTINLIATHLGDLSLQITKLQIANPGATDIRIGTGSISIATARKLIENVIKLRELNWLTINLLETDLNRLADVMWSHIQGKYGLYLATTTGERIKLDKVVAKEDIDLLVTILKALAVADGAV